MSSVLHILEVGRTGWMTEGLVRAEASGAGDRAVVIGRGPTDQVPGRGWADGRVGSVLGGAALAWGGVRAVGSRLARERACGRGDAEQWERVHAWSIGALAAGWLAFPHAGLAVTLGFPPMSPWEARLGRWLLGSGPLGGRVEPVRYLSPSVRDAWAREVGAAALEGSLLPIPAGIDRAVARTSAGLDAAALRAAWGVGAGERVLLALGDAPELVDARRFVFHLGVMSIAGKRVVGVVPSRSRHLERAVRFTRRHEHGAGGQSKGGWRLVIDDTPLPGLVGAADVGVRASEHAAWSEALAERAGASGLAGGAGGLAVVRAEAPTMQGAGDRIAGLRALLRMMEAGGRGHGPGTRARGDGASAPRPGLDA